MPPLIYRWIVKKLSVVAFCILGVCVLTPDGLAQHTVSHGTGTAVHTSVPPTFHASPAPILHVPTSSARILSGSSAHVAIGTAGLRPPRRPIRPFPPVLVLYETPFLPGGPYSGWNSCWWASCDFFWFWAVDYTSVSSPGPANYVSQVYEAPVYYGEEGQDVPQLILKDGTILNVTDYWLVDNQLHFTMIEEEDGKPVEHVIPFDALNLQKSVTANTRRGFRFMLRDEPFEQYVRDHPEGPPPVVTLPNE